MVLARVPVPADRVVRVVLAGAPVPVVLVPVSVPAPDPVATVTGIVIETGIVTAIATGMEIAAVPVVLVAGPERAAPEDPAPVQAVAIVAATGTAIASCGTVA